MDTRKVKERIQMEISSIEKRLDELKDETSRLEARKALFDQAQEAITMAEELALQLDFVPEIEVSATSTVAAQTGEQSARDPAPPPLEEPPKTPAAGVEEHWPQPVATHLQVVDGSEVDSQDEPAREEEPEPAAQPKVEHPADRFDHDSLIPNFLRQYL